MRDSGVVSAITSWRVEEPDHRLRDVVQNPHGRYVAGETQNEEVYDTPHDLLEVLPNGPVTVVLLITYVAVAIGEEMGKHVWIFVFAAPLEAVCRRSQGEILKVGECVDIGKCHDR